MKKILFLVVMVIVTITAPGQKTLLGLYGVKNSDGGFPGVYIDLGLSKIKDTANFGLIDFYVGGGFAAKLNNNVALGGEIGAYRQSDVFTYKEETQQNQWASYYYGPYDYGCGCYLQPQTVTKYERFQYFEYRHAVVSFTWSERGTMFRLTPGAGYFTLKYPTYDSLQNYLGDQVVAKRWTYHLGVKFMKKFSWNNVVFLRGFMFQDVERQPFVGVFYVGEAGILFPVSKNLENFRMGFGGYYRDHALSGRELSLRLLLNVGWGQKTTTSLSGFMGLAGNEQRGLRFEAGFSFGFDTLAKGFF